MNTEKIEKLKKGLTNSQIPESLREKIRQQISRLEAEDKANEPAPKEEAMPKKEVTPKAPTVRKPTVRKPTVRKPRAKKVVEPKTSTAGKTTAMSLAKEIRKDGEKWTDAVKRAGMQMKKGTTEVKKSTKTEMQKLLALVKRRKELKGISGTDIKRDSQRKAKPRGARTVTNSGQTSNKYGTYDNKLGRKYTENRDNRTDRLAPKYPKNSPLLELGGGVDETKYIPHYAPQASGFGKIYSSELNDGNQYTYGQGSNKNYGKSDDNRGYLYKENGIYFVNGFKNGKHFSETFEKFTDAKKFYLDKKTKSYENGGGVDEDIIVIYVDNYPYYLKKEGDSTHFAMSNSKDGVDIVTPSHIGQHRGEVYYEDIRSWLKGGKNPNGNKYKSKNSYELGGTVVTDLAGNTSGGDLGLNAGMPLSGFSNTAYTGLVGETGAMSSGEMFELGGTIDSENITLAKRLKVKKWYTKTYPTDDLGQEIREDLSFWSFWSLMSQGYDVYSILGVSDSLVRERVFGKLSKILEVDYDVIYKKWLNSNKYENGGGLPQGSEQHYVNYYLGSGTAQGIFEHGGGMHDYKKMEDNYANGGFMDNVYAGGGKVHPLDITLLWRGYASAILFAEMDYDTDEPLDNDYSIYDFDKKSEADAKKMLSMYYSKNEKAIKESGLDLETIGMDIWYTQGGHGAGFFDHSLTQNVEDKLTQGANEFGMPSIETYNGKVIIRGISFENGGFMNNVYAKGGGIRIKNGQTYDYGRVWTNDHNQFDKGAEHEVNYRK
jgi:hypothetical protein